MRVLVLGTTGYVGGGSPRACWRQDIGAELDRWIHGIIGGAIQKIAQLAETVPQEAYR
ncbi:MAG: hypothetical protein K6U12_09860 [Armatimonadetes bacterium]|nr:hypothetical protein [Armatimonadota bacterium]